MQRSAMSDHQRSSILSNELVRRLSNFNLGWVDWKEALDIIEKFIQQLKNSGYEQKQTREILICGLKTKRKLQGRKSQSRSRKDPKREKGAKKIGRMTNLRPKRKHQ